MEIVWFLLMGVIVYQAVLQVIMQHQWHKRERELLDRVMAQNLPEYIAGQKKLRGSKKAKIIKPEPIDILPVT